MVLSRIETRYEALEVPDWPVCQESGIGCRRKMRAAFPEKRSLEVCSGACWNPVFAELYRDYGGARADNFKFGR
jgi:hypothetical protein